MHNLIMLFDKSFPLLIGQSVDMVESVSERIVQEAVLRLGNKIIECNSEFGCGKVA